MTISTSAEHEPTLRSLLLACVKDLQPSVADAMATDPSLMSNLSTSAALCLIKLAHTAPHMGASTGSTSSAPSLGHSFENDTSEASRAAKTKEDTEAQGVVTDLVGSVAATDFGALRSTATLAGDSLLRQLATSLTNSHTTTQTDPAKMLRDILSPDLLALVLIASLWLSCKFWLPAIQRVSLNSLLLHLTESMDNLDSHAPPDAGVVEVDTADLLMPPPMDDDLGGLVGAGAGDGGVVGSALRFESSDLRGGESSDWIPTVADAVEAVEMLLLRCCAYTVPLPTRA